MKRRQNDVIKDQNGIRLFSTNLQKKKKINIILHFLGILFEITVALQADEDDYINNVIRR